MARSCPSIAEHGRATACPDLSRQRAEAMTLQHISAEIDTTQPGENVSNLMLSEADTKRPGNDAVPGLLPATWLREGTQDPWAHWHSLTP
eukprot:6073738-Prorocentrum_lima.AAC.1